MVFKSHINLKFKIFDQVHTLWKFVRCSELFFPVKNFNVTVLRVRGDAVNYVLGSRVRIFGEQRLFRDVPDRLKALSSFCNSFKSC